MASAAVKDGRVELSARRGAHARLRMRTIRSACKARWEDRMIKILEVYEGRDFTFMTLFEMQFTCKYIAYITHKHYFQIDRAAARFKEWLYNRAGGPDWSGGSAKSAYVQLPPSLLDFLRLSMMLLSCVFFSR